MIYENKILNALGDIVYKRRGIHLNPLTQWRLFGFLNDNDWLPSLDS